MALGRWEKELPFTPAFLPTQPDPSGGRKKADNEHFYLKLNICFIIFHSHTRDQNHPILWQRAIWFLPSSSPMFASLFIFQLNMSRLFFCCWKAGGVSWHISLITCQVGKDFRQVTGRRDWQCALVETVVITLRECKYHREIYEKWATFVKDFSANFHRKLNEKSRLS